MKHKFVITKKQVSSQIDHPSHIRCAFLVCLYECVCVCVCCVCCVYLCVVYNFMCMCIHICVYVCVYMCVCVYVYISSISVLLCFIEPILGGLGPGPPH